MSHDTIQSSGGLHASVPRCTPGLLQLWAPDGAVQRFVAVRSEVVLGREAPAVALRDARVSREHCRIRHDGVLWSVEDLDSRNGTYLDGARVRGSGYAQSGQVVRVGHCVFLLGEQLAAHAEAVEVDAAGEVAGGRMRAALRAVRERAASGEHLLLVCPVGAGEALALRRFRDASRGPEVRFSAAGLAPRVAGEALRAAADAAGRGTLIVEAADELGGAAQCVLRDLLGRDGPRVCVVSRTDLRDALVSRSVREDLFYRLDAARVELPALAERLEEVPFLLQHTLAGARQRVDVSLVERCLRLPWPGNVRELLAEVRAAGQVARAAGRDEVRGRDLAAGAGRPGKPREPATPLVSAALLGDPAAVAAALAAEAGNVQASARLLGVHRNQLRRWLSRHKAAPGPV